jgi:putative transcriptional regulator
LSGRLRELRQQQGWTQAELGQRLGVSRQAVNALESGKHDPSLDLAFRIAALFDQAVEDVFENPHRR